MENASHAFLDAVCKSMRQVRMAIGSATVNPKLLTGAERLQYKGYLRREEANAVIRGSVSEGLSIKEIVRRTVAAASAGWFWRRPACYHRMGNETKTGRKG